MTIERHVLFWVLAIVGLATFITVLAPVLLPFVIGLTLAYFFNPLADALSRAGVSRWLSATLILLAVTTLLVLTAVFLIPLLAQQTAGLIETLPGEMTRLRGLIEEGARERLGERYPAVMDAVTRTLSGLSESLPAIATNMAQSVWSQGQAAFNALSLVLITPLVFFYAVMDWPKIIAKVDSWLPRQNAPAIRELALEIDSRVSAFIRGQGVVCLVLAIFYATALSLIGVRYGLLVGLLTGLLSFIPFVGWILGLITATALAIVQFWPDLTSILLVPGVFLAGQALDAAVLSPQIVGSKIGLHPVWLIFALMTFSYLFGFLGLLVAVPVAAAIGVLVRAALQSYMASSVYTGANS
jgi:predicted PurR-regulated permease PerM